MSDHVQESSGVAGEVVQLVPADHDPVLGRFPDPQHQITRLAEPHRFGDERRQLALGQVDHHQGGDLTRPHVHGPLRRCHRFRADESEGEAVVPFITIAPTFIACSARRVQAGTYRSVPSSILGTGRRIVPLRRRRPVLRLQEVQDHEVTTDTRAGPDGEREDLNGHLGPSLRFH